jgi:uncharacterized protein YkwD
VAVCAPLASLLLAGAALADDGVQGRTVETRPAPEVCPGERQTPTAKTLEIARAATLCLLSQERTSRGLAPLTEGPLITQRSQAYSERMVAERFFAHSPVGYLLMDVHWIVGQNLAWADSQVSTPGRVVAAWMASPGHRANILNPEATDVGIGIALGSPDPRSRVPAAVYTTDFGAIADGTVATVPLQPVTRPTRIKKPPKRIACRTTARGRRARTTAAKVTRSRCARRARPVQRARRARPVRPVRRARPVRPVGPVGPAGRRAPGRQAPETLPTGMAFVEN